MRPRVTKERCAGVLLPLASLRTARDWGVGDFTDLALFGPVLAAGGFRALMTLPLLEPTPGIESPYSPCSAFALDPMYIDVEKVDGVVIGAVEEQRRDRLRAGLPLRAAAARELKIAILRRAFPGPTPALDAFVAANPWVTPYARFRALKTRYRAGCFAWPEALRDPGSAEVAKELADLADEVAFRAWLQMLAAEQLAAARAVLQRHGVALGGDEPFLTAGDSADVWSRPDRYRYDATAGAPPDAFSDDGQDWGLPPYRWEVLEDEGYEAFALRGEHASQLYDFVRVDHVVGLFRSWIWPPEVERDAEGRRLGVFVPTEKKAQIAQGKAVLQAFQRSGVELLAEDLGVVPPFVRTTLRELGVPGYKVFRWELEDDGRPIDPATWPELSVATTGTHDTSPCATWWEEELDDDARQAFRKGSPRFARVGDHTTDAVRRAWLDVVYESPSYLALLPFGDLFGYRERINIPATVGPHNWTWRLPFEIEALEREDHLRALWRELRQRALATRRA
jgi:4-alpha-glucanotransferase